MTCENYEIKNEVAYEVVDICKSFSLWVWNGWYEYIVLRRQSMLLGVRRTCYH